MLADTPATSDHLGLGRYFRALAEFIQECDTPLTIAIQGGWGTGKTSALQIIEGSLDTAQTETIWFDTWQYAVAGADNLLLMLLMNEFDKKDKELEQRFERLKARSTARTVAINRLITSIEASRAGSENVTERILNTARIIIAGAAEGFASHVGGDAAGDAVKGATKRLLSFDNLDTVATTKDEMQLAVDSLLGFSRKLEVLEAALGDGQAALGDGQAATSGASPSVPWSVDSVGTKDRLVVFVDDLDRLDPLRALEFLEGIKNFIDCKNCVFVLAIDDRVVNQGIVQKYRIEVQEEAARSTVQFFDKIIQVPFRMREDHYDFGLYIRQEGFLGARARTDDLVDSYIRCIAELGPRNPRSIKRVFNLVNLYRRILSPDGAASGDRAARRDFYLFVILLMQTAHAGLFDRLLSLAATGVLVEKVLVGGETDDSGPCPQTRLDALRRALGGVPRGGMTGALGGVPRGGMTGALGGGSCADGVPATDAVGRVWEYPADVPHEFAEALRQFTDIPGPTGIKSTAPLSE